VGKDTLLAPMMYAICGPDLKNHSIIDTKSLSSQWGYCYESEVVVVNELRADQSKDRRALENQLKPIIAAPPMFLDINRKGLHPYKAVNRLLVIAFSNFRDAIAISSDDRRWFAAWCHGAIMPKEESARLWAWYHGPGFGAVAAYLGARDVSRYDPAAPPKMNEAKMLMIQQARSVAEEYLIDEIERGRGDFELGVIATPFHKLLDRLQGMAPQGMKLYPMALHHALQESGWVDRGICVARGFSSGKRVYCAPKMSELSNSALRELITD